MNKYKKGDKFIVEIEDVGATWLDDPHKDEYFYKMKNFNTVRLSERYLDKMQKIDETKTYEQGLADAWEVAKKIICEVKYGGFTQNELQKFFGEIYASDIMMKFASAEAIAEIKKHEKQQAINVGDEVYFYSECRGVLICKDDNSYTIYGMMEVLLCMISKNKEVLN